MDINSIRSGSFATDSRPERLRSGFIVVCWNIERGLRWTEIHNAVRGPLVADLYLLQEVDWNARRTGYRDVAADLARATGTNYVFAIEFEELAQGREGQPAFHGQAVLSRAPIAQARILRFRYQPCDWNPWWKPNWAWTQPRRGGRLALVVEIQYGGHSLVVYNAHLESRADEAGRARQMDEILRDIHQHYPLEKPVIVAGDLNTRDGANSRVLRELRAAGFCDVFESCDGPLFTKVRANRRADWIFVRNLRFSDAEVSQVVASDHYPLRVHLALPRPATTASSSSYAEGATP